MLKNKLMLALTSLGFVPAIAMADAPADAAKAPVPTFSQVLDASGITATGYLDIGYTNLNSTGLFVSGTPTRVFDAPSAAAGYNADSFNLNQAAITVSKQPKVGFGGVINLTAGQDAKVIASNGTTPGNLDVTQAYASYAGGPMAVIAGKFVTLAGAEVINSPSNTNYSRSILFGYAIPFSHTGVRLTYAASDAISLIAGVNNGWDQVSDLNTSKTVELGFTASPSKMFSLTGAYYGGQEPTTPGTNGNRQLFDLVGTINPIDKLSVILNYDHGSQDNASLADGTTGTGTWDGLAGYLNYQFSDQWRASLRSEYMKDSDGVRLPYVGTAGQKWKETTLTMAYMPTASLEFRGEIRGDSSNEAVFLKSDGTAKSDQMSFALEALYKF